MAINYKKLLLERLEKLTKNIEKEFNNAYKRAGLKWLATIGPEVESVYNKSIEAFYNDYTPVPEGYERRESLYKLFSYKFKNNKAIIDIDDSEPKARDDSTSLYDLVFKEGYHGGSKHGDGVGGPHPRPGTPLWREPINGYFNWGREAEQSETSPYDEFKKRLEEWKEGEGKTIFNNIFMKEFSEMQKNIHW